MMIFGIFLVLIGFLWLISSLGIISTTVSQVIWPLIVIAIGEIIYQRVFNQYNQF